MQTPGHPHTVDKKELTECALDYGALHLNNKRNITARSEMGLTRRKTVYRFSFRELLWAGVGEQPEQMEANVWARFTNTCMFFGCWE